MEDDVFQQLASLVNDKPTYNNATPGFGAVNFGQSSDSSDDIFHPTEEMFENDEMIVPKIKPKKAVGSKRRIVVIDDDFSTLDLMKIYLQRDYEYVSFDNPKNAIFYVNSNIPDLIFIDCYLNTVKTKRVVDILRTYKELANVPIIYLAEPSEQAAIGDKLPEGVVGIISRPVKRGELQNILDTFIVNSGNGDDDIDPDVPKDHPIM